MIETMQSAGINSVPLSQEAIDALCKLVRTPTNKTVKKIVFEALKTNTTPNYQSLDRNMKKYVRASFEAFKQKIVNLNRLKLMLPVIERDEEYILLVTTFYQRTAPFKTIEILKAVLCKKQSQSGASTLYDVPQGNVSRLVSKFEAVEADAKQAIVAFLL